jgi:hypothetical protein
MHETDNSKDGAAAVADSNDPVVCHKKAGVGTQSKYADSAEMTFGSSESKANVKSPIKGAK